VRRLGAGVAVAALVAGCSTTGSSSSSTVVAKGSTLVIYLSQPPSPNPVQKQVLEAEQLACQQLTGSISGTSLSVKCDTVGDRELSDNARAAIQDESSIAYVGEIEPGDSEQTLGITNALDLPQVSPTDTAVELTQAVSAVPGSPANYYEAASTYGRTFARIAPTSAQEAQAALAQMKKLGVRNLYVTGDTSDYGNALQAAVRSDASAQGITVNNSEAAVDAIFYAGDSPSAAERYAASASSTAVSAKLFLPSALAGLNFSTGDWSRFKAVYVSEPGAPSSADKSFVSQFSSRYGSPDPQAAYGYAAVQAIIHVLHEAGKSANNRGTVVKGLHELRNFSSVVGPISISSSGASSLGPSAFVFRQVRGGTLAALISNKIVKKTSKKTR
jgi:ABC-type branched-subunit amino acid transport system substrate-binding protein